MSRAIAFRIWNLLFLALVLIPLAIFWEGRGDVFPHASGSPDVSLLAHIFASAMYVSMVVLAAAWLRAGGKQAVLVGALTLSAAVGAVVAFERVGAAAVKAAGVSGLGFDIAVAILIYFSAGVAASSVLVGIVVAVRRLRAR